jgi:hypothetical protein
MNDETPKNYEPGHESDEAEVIKPVAAQMENQVETRPVPTIDNPDDMTLRSATVITPSTESGKKVQEMLGVKDSSDPNAKVIKNVDIQADNDARRQSGGNAISEE